MTTNPVHLEPAFVIDPQLVVEDTDINERDAFPRVLNRRRRVYTGLVIEYLDMGQAKSVTVIGERNSPAETGNGHVFQCHRSRKYIVIMDAVEDDPIGVFISDQAYPLDIMKE
ncbi:hypothetical protein CFR71_09145 [Novacetimonas pomaceti]|uniref:Uncharacterized protein n=1 Tax=Novacetimonas pomaceti TaxID=2021998 RepID=A0A318Q7A6_9PROT|nr:hypothetical protein CFR71_09145 [Novacetimonas pomaceti]